LFACNGDRYAKALLDAGPGQRLAEAIGEDRPFDILTGVSNPIA
jgi:hypothetical protein